MVEFYLKLKLKLRIISYLTYICWEIDNFVIKSDIFRQFFICKNILKKLSCYHNNYFRYFLFGKYNGFVSKARVSACMYFLVPSYSDGSFRSHFRLSRRSAEILVGLLTRCPEVPSQHLRGRPPVSVGKQLLITLWVLGNPEVIRSVSDRFNVTKYSVFRNVRRVCRAIVNNLAAQFICSPKGDRVKKVM